MGIAVEFNPDLALRDIARFKDGSRLEDECIPEVLEIGKTYSFRKRGQRLYWLHGELPLLKTDGTNLSLPMASVVLGEVTHSLVDGEVCTTGTYQVKEIYTDSTPHFNGFAKI